jgi:ribosomal protein S18
MPCACHLCIRACVCVCVQNRVLLESPVQWKQDFQIRPVLALLQRHSRLQQLQRYLDNEQPVLQKKVLEANQSAQYETIFTYDRPKPISRRARKHSCMFCRPDTSDNQGTHCTTHPFTRVCAHVYVYLCALFLSLSVCTAEKQLVVTNVELLLRFVNIRGMLLNRRTTGLCGPHQRKGTHLSLSLSLSLCVCVCVYVCVCECVESSRILFSVCHCSF